MTMRGVVRCLAAAILSMWFGLLLLPMPAQAEVNCSSLDLQLDLPGMPKFCNAGEERGRNAGSDNATGWTVSWESVSVSGNTVTVQVNFVQAGRRTYIERQPVRALLDSDRWFAKSRAWGEAHPIGSYEVQRFEGAWTENGGFWSCAAFGHYAGQVSGSPGYRYQVIGAYCVPEGKEVGEETLRKLIDSIRY